jgi:putative ABC transport system permease protein
MDTLTRDVTHTFRLLARSRAFAVAALVTIAVGVGGTAAVFSVVYGVLLRPLPYAEPDRLVRMWEVHPGAQAPINGQRLSGPTYRAWTRSSDSLQEIGAFSGADFTVTSPNATSQDTAQRLRGAKVTPSVFRLLRVSPIAGRFFTDTDADEGAPPVVVLSYGLWRERFGGAASKASAIGQRLRIDDVDYEIVGVAPAGFAFPDKTLGARDDRREVMLYAPFGVRPRAPNPKVIDYTEAIARVKPGISIARVEAEGTSLARAANRPRAELVFGSGGGPVEVRVRSMVDQMTMTVRPALLVLAAGVIAVLLIACANVANLFLSHGSDRGRELAVRLALGASRRRLVRQLFTESLVIALLGGVLGVLIGWALTAAVPALAPADFPRLDQIQVDARFLIVSFLTATFVGVFSGAMPALRGSRIDLAGSMRTGGARTIGSSGARMRRLLLAVEAALAVVLLVAAVLLARSFGTLLHVDAGYEPLDVLTADVRVPGRNDARTSEVARTLLERLRAMPGVRAAGAGDMAPFGSMLSSVGFALPGMIGPDGKPVTANALRAIVTPGYAEALGMRLKEGRLFREEDSTSAIRPMLVNATFAKTYLADGRPVAGRGFNGLFPAWLGNDTAFEIVGVVEDMLPAELDARAQPQIFLAAGGKVQIGHVTLVVKTEDDPLRAVSALRSLVRQVEPGAIVERLGPLTSKVAASVGEPRFATVVLMAFAVLALVLASTGLYGVLSYDIAQRRRELAVRAALGARRADLVRMVMREGLTMTVVGLGVGVVLATFATRLMASALFGVTPLDGIAFATGPLVLFVVACVACLLPARRAVRIDPAEALKLE